MRMILLLTAMTFMGACASTQKKLPKKYSLIGTYSCPGTKYKTKEGKSIEHPAFTQTIDIKNVNGVDVMITDYKDKNPEEPYSQMIAMNDGKWYYKTMWNDKKKKIKAYKAKSTLNADGVYEWESDVPAFESKKHGKFPASKNKGKFWVDPATGDKMSVASFAPGQTFRCKRIK